LEAFFPRDAQRAKLKQRRKKKIASVAAPSKKAEGRSIDRYQYRKAAMPDGTGKETKLAAGG
jgi:hypothetical protein